MCSFCRPATEGSLDPYTPLIEVPDGIPKSASAAQDLPYYFAIVQSTKPAEVRDYADACHTLPLRPVNKLQLCCTHLRALHTDRLYSARMAWREWGWGMTLRRRNASASWLYHIGIGARVAIVGATAVHVRRATKAESLKRVISCAGRGSSAAGPSSRGMAPELQAAGRWPSDNSKAAGHPRHGAS